MYTEKIRKACFAFATLGSLGEWRLGGALASILGIPFLLLLQSVYWLNQTLFYWTIVAVIIVFLVAIQWALQHSPERAQRAIVLDKIIGVMIGLAGIPLRWRVIIFGFIIFHLLNTLQPFSWYRQVVHYLERLPGVFGILGAEILSGALVNVFLHLIAWVMVC